MDLLYPPHCYLCEKPLREHRYICENCLEKMNRIESPYCGRCGRPVFRAGGLCSRCAEGEREFFLARSVGLYLSEEPLAQSITGLKYEGERALARDLAGLFLSGSTEELLDYVQAITFVPQSERRGKERPFNHARSLALNLSRLTSLPFFRGLRKVDQTEPQASLGREERLHNLEGSFAPTQGWGYDNVLLIDDVFTTGATADECAKTLREGGCERVCVATLARRL